MATNLRWQEDQSLSQCTRHMLESGLLSDITFRVGLPEGEKQTIQAHRFILVSRSPVFEALFCGNWADTKEDTLNIEDIEPAIFKHLLSYLYTDVVDLTENNALNVLYAAQKYIMPSLERKCTDFLTAAITETNVCTILSQAVQIHKQEIETKCLEFIQNNTVSVLASEDFLTLSQEALCLVLDKDELETEDEIEVIQACVSWAYAKSETPDTDSDHWVRDVLGNARPLIRFPAANPQDLTRELHNKQILTDTEKAQIYHYFLTKEGHCDGMVAGYKIKPRLCNAVRSIDRFYCACITTGWPCSGVDGDFVCMLVDKPITLLGITIYRTVDYSPITSLKCEIRYSGSDELIMSTEMGGIQCRRVTQPMISVRFTNPIPLEAAVMYQIGVFIVSNRTLFGLCGKKQVFKDGCCFTFSQSQHNRLRTTDDRGQIPGILYRISTPS